jgi:hypothetical protein
MTQKRYALLIAIAMSMVAASLSGCGSTGSGPAASEQSLTAKADVTISARFPTSSSAAKSLIPDGTQVIEVYADQVDTQNQSTLIATLTPAAPTKTVKMGTGLYYFYAYAYDSANAASRTELAWTSTGGEIRTGVTNSVNLSFLNGQWTIVNAADAPTPIVLSDGTQLIDFIVGENYAYVYKAGKSSIDYTKPVGNGEGPVRLRFDNNTSARTNGWMASQFIGAAASTFVSAEGYNLTKKCSFDTYYGIPCDDSAGNQIVMIGGKDSAGSGDYQSGGYYEGNLLSGSAETLLPNGGKTAFSLAGQPFDLMTALPDTTVTGGSTISGGIVEWKPLTNRITSLGTPPVAKSVNSSTVVKAQTANTPYANITVKESDIIVCSGSKPQNRGTWSFASYTSSGKVVLGNRVCYTNYPSLNNYNPVTNSTGTDKGDYSYGLEPSPAGSRGDYCHVWDVYTNSCTRQMPVENEVYMPWNFKAVKSASKQTIDYGSFKFNFWAESTQTGTAYVYPFRAKGSIAVKAAPAAPVISSVSVPASVSTGTSAIPLAATAYDPNGDSIAWSWSIVSGGGTLGSGCNGSGTSSVTSSCSYTAPVSAVSVTLRFTASDGVRSNSKERVLSVSDGTTVVIQ